MATTKKKTAMVDGEEIALPVCGSDGEPVKFALIGCDSNAYSVLGGVAKAMRRAGVKREVIDAYKAESTSGDYNHLISTAMDWIEEDSTDEEWDESMDDDEDDWGGE